MAELAPRRRISSVSGDPIELGFMARVFVQATLPHKSTDSLVFTRRNGRLKLKITADKDFGLPYGRYPRLLLAWMTREACRTKSRRLELGHSLSSFMAQLGLTPTGGRSGTIPRLRDQMTRLFLSTLSCTEYDPEHGKLGDDRFTVANRTRLWWSPTETDDKPLWGSYVVLSELGYRALAERPVPVDMAVLRALRSPLALDVYCWLTYRNSYLRRPTRIPWPALAGLAALRGTDSFQIDEIKETIESALRAATIYGSYSRSRGRIAMTIHTAKNQEFDNVVVLWPAQVPDDESYCRRLLYNAITRARHRALVLVQGGKVLRSNEAALRLLR